MRTIGFSFPLLICALAAFGQTPPAATGSNEQPEKARPEVDEALRAQVNKFYGAFVAGKFKDAYLLVADDSQDKFFELDKTQYHSCEIDVVQYSEHATKATVVTKCKGEWRLQGRVFPVTFPVRSNWEIVDGKWYWHYVRPSMVQSPFSTTGWVPVPPESKDGTAPILPKDFAAVAQGILAKVAVDKTSVRFGLNQASQEVVHVRNDMPGEVSLLVQEPGVPGLKISLGQTKLQAHQQTDLVFAWSPGDAAKSLPNAIVQVRVSPTNQIFPIAVIFDNGSSGAKAPPAQVPAPPQN